MIDLAGAQVDNAWWYVGAAYVIIFSGMALFVAWLGLRIRRARRELEEMS